MRQFEVAIDWCSYQAENLDLVLVISGCQTNCADTDILSHASLLFLTDDSEYEVIAKRISSLVSIDDSLESLS